MLPKTTNPEPSIKNAHFVGSRPSWAAGTASPFSTVRMWLSNLARRILVALGIRPKADLIARIVEDNPAPGELRQGEMLIVGGPGYKKWAYLLCPCGCGAVTMLRLSPPTARPRWRVTLDRFNRPSVYPSVWRTEGCRSHYWIAAGTLVWVREDRDV